MKAGGILVAINAPRVIGLCCVLACVSCSHKPDTWEIRTERRNDVISFGYFLRIYSNTYSEFPHNRWLLGKIAPQTEWGKCDFLITTNGVWIYSVDVLPGIPEGGKIGQSRFTSVAIPPGRVVMKLGDDKPVIMPENTWRKITGRGDLASPQAIPLNK